MTERVDEEEIIRMAFERSPVGMVVVDAAGVIVLVNPQTERLFRYGSDELIGKPVETLVPQRFAAQHANDRAAFVHSPAARPMGAGRDLFGVRKDGSEFPVEIALNPVRSGRKLFVLATMVDISERKQAERRLRDSEERFRRLLEGARDYAVYMVDPEGFIMSYSPGAERIFGYGEREITGQHLTVLLDEPERAPGRVESRLAEAAERGRLEEEAWSVAAGGRRFFANTITTPVREPDGTLSGFVRVTRDITERVQIEERLRQSQKLEAIGTLAGGIAHDFNNILLGILGYGELVREALKDDTRAQGDLDLMLASAGRGRDLVRRILTFTRQRDVTTRVPVQLERPVRETLQLLRASLPTTIEIDAHVDAATPAVLSDEAQIHQIVMNLATNAAHAMPAGGVLGVRVQPIQLDSEAVKEHPHLKPGLHARITVSDTGTGMSDEVLTRVFDPFFTTKPQGQGTGLGLPLMHGIVRGLDGTIEIKSRLGEGTSVDVFLPAASLAHDKDQPSSKAAAKPPRPLILFVDDESHLTQLGKRLIEGFGYAVVAYTSSLLALEDFRSRPGAFDLVITDNTMPHMTGLALIEEIHRTRPELPTMMISGIAEVMDIDQLSSRGVRALLPKPYAPQELKTAISGLLGK